NELATDFQESIGPLQQALQAIQYAQSVAQQNSPLSVLSPGGINVLPGQGPDGNPALGQPGFASPGGGGGAAGGPPPGAGGLGAPGGGMAPNPAAGMGQGGNSAFPQPMGGFPDQGKSARRYVACYPGCHEDEEHAAKFHDNKESYRRRAMNPNEVHAP